MSDPVTSNAWAQLAQLRGERDQALGLAVSWQSSAEVTARERDRLRAAIEKVLASPANMGSEDIETLLAALEGRDA